MYTVEGCPRVIQTNAVAYGAVCDERFRQQEGRSTEEELDASWAEVQNYGKQVIVQKAGKTVPTYSAKTIPSLQKAQQQKQANRPQIKTDMDLAAARKVAKASGSLPAGASGYIVVSAQLAYDLVSKVMKQNFQTQRGFPSSSIAFDCISQLIQDINEQVTSETKTGAYEVGESILTSFVLYHLHA